MSVPMSVPGTAADVSTSYYDSISTVPGTGTPVNRILSLREEVWKFSTFDFGLSTLFEGTPAHRGPSIRVEGR